MAKKDLERLLQRFKEHVSRFSPGDQDLTRPEVAELLASAGCDTNALRQRLYETAKDLANEQRARGRPAPEYLRRVIDLTSPPEQLPSDLKLALEKARAWVHSLTRAPDLSATDVQILRAYRKRGEISDKDAALLDALEQELKNDSKNE